jgi:3-oxoadipate enol-lactonase/4-carboxymuconolactone decarboxylase
MTVPRITGVQLSEPGAGPLLLLGPSLGTSVTALWSACARQLGQRFHLVGWDLPGHGRSAAAGDAFTMAELAEGVLGVADAALADRDEPAGPFRYAGVSVGGAVGLQLLLNAPARVTSAALICTGAVIGDPQLWADRAATVRASGTPALVSGSTERWFAPGFVSHRPDVAASLLQSLRDADAEGYAQVCEALAEFDVRERLAEVTAPVLAVAGAADAVTPTASLEQLSTGIADATLVVVDGVAHLAPAEDPDRIAALLLDHFTAARPGPVGGLSPYDAGMAVRREVLGAAHVDRAIAATTEFTAEFQELITSYAWGGIWTRPGLDRRSRSLITLTALVARGHHEELAMHVRAARTNGLTNDEIKELLLQTAIYCGVPDANAAFRIAQQVLAELDDPAAPPAAGPGPSNPTPAAQDSTTPPRPTTEDQP